MDCPLSPPPLLSLSQIHIVMPIVEKKLNTLTERRFGLRGELACVVQFGYELAAPYIQRAVRGCFLRKKVSRWMTDLVSVCVYSCIVYVCI